LKEKLIKTRLTIKSLTFIELKKMFRNYMLIVEDYSQIIENNFNKFSSQKKELLRNRLNKTQSLLDKWKLIEEDIIKTPTKEQREFFEIATENIFLTEISLTLPQLENCEVLNNN